MEAIKLEGLSKNYGALSVLKDISFSVQEGERVAIIGPNGAGKTTFMNVLSGEFPPTAGKVTIFGKDVSTQARYHRVHEGMSRSFQIVRIFNGLSVAQNILLALQGTKMSRYNPFRAATTYKDVNARAEELLGTLNLWDIRNQSASSISYGNKRKLEIALSLACEPRLLLLDEPSCGLDVGEIDGFIKLIKEISKNLTLVFSAHDMDVVFGLAERVVVLYYGSFFVDGTPEEIRNHPKVLEIYLGKQEEECSDVNP
jgi:branched-chain amino acid transport system ATP-binding protein